MTARPLWLLHGAIGASDQLVRFEEAFRELPASVHRFDFPGHGGKPLPDGSFSIRFFAEELIRYWDESGVTCADIFGYSMGGYVALYMARHYPSRVGRIMTVGTKLHWDIPTSQKEVKMLDPEKIREKVPRFAEALEKRHAPADWKKVLEKTGEMMIALGERPELSEEDFRSVEHSVMLSVGDRDTMVSIEETVHVYRMLKNGSLWVIPQTQHPVEQLDIKKVMPVVKQYFLQE